MEKEQKFKTGDRVIVNKTVAFFPIENIKAGYLLKIRDDDGEEYFMFVNNNKRDQLDCCSADGDNFWDLQEFNDELIYLDSRIVAIYGCASNDCMLNENPSGRDLFWKRVEKPEIKKMTVAEVCEALGYDIEIVKE